MTTDQKYDGKGELQPSLEQTAPETGPTVDSRPSAVGSPAAAPTQINLPSYFEQVTDSRQGVSAFRNALADTFIGYLTSEKFIHGEDKDVSIEVITSMHAGIAQFIERVADQKLGPKVPAPDPQARIILSDAISPGAYVAFAGNPLAQTDLATLQDWVATLQLEVDLLSAENERLIQSRDEKETANATLRELVSNYEAIKAVDQKTIALLEAGQEEGLKATSSFSLNLSVSDHTGTPSAVLVYWALSEYRDERLKGAIDATKLKRTEEAVDEYEQYETMKRLIDHMLHDMIRLSRHNYNAPHLNTLRAVASRQSSMRLYKDMQREEYLTLFVGPPPADEDEEESPADPQ